MTNAAHDFLDRNCFGKHIVISIWIRDIKISINIRRTLVELSSQTFEKQCLPRYDASSPYINNDKNVQI